MHHIHRLMKTAFKFAIKTRQILINPMDGVDAPRVRKGKIRVLEPSEFQKILLSLNSGPSMWRSLWRITLLTGLRQGEVLGLAWENVDIDKRTIYISQQLQRQTGKGSN